MTFAWPYKCGAREIGSARLRSFVGCRRRTGATGYVLSLPTRTRNVTLHVLGFRFLSLVIVLITKLPLPCKSTDCLLSLISFVLGGSYRRELSRKSDPPAGLHTFAPRALSVAAVCVFQQKGALGKEGREEKGAKPRKVI